MVPHNYYGVEEETAKRYVQKLATHIRAVQDACKELGVSDDQARRHDLSKWRSDEFPAYAIAKFDGSPQSEEFQRAWLHHVNHNPHHWQHWVLYKSPTENKVLRMPNKYALEMVGDWMGAELVYSGSTDMSKWLLENIPKIRVHPETALYLGEVLKGLGYGAIIERVKFDTGKDK